MNRGCVSLGLPQRGWGINGRLFENRVLREIPGPKKDVVPGEWRRLHNEELHDLSSSTNTRVIKSRGKRWEGEGAILHYGGGRGFCGETWRKEPSLKT
jgi:hypothetical protein